MTRELCFCFGNNFLEIFFRKQTQRFIYQRMREKYKFEFSLSFLNEGLSKEDFLEGSTTTNWLHEKLKSKSSKTSI